MENTIKNIDILLYFLNFKTTDDMHSDENTPPIMGIEPKHSITKSFTEKCYFARVKPKGTKQVWRDNTEPLQGTEVNAETDEG